MATTFEHNSDAHQNMLHEHFLEPTEYGFFIGLRQPDAIETFSWGTEDALPSLLENLGHNFYTTYLVEPQNIQSLVSELAELIPATARDLIGTKWWKKDEAAYIAVWTLEDNLCLVGVASSLQDSWEAPNTPVWCIAEHNPEDSLEHCFDCFEDDLEDGNAIPVDEFFSVLLEHIHTNNDPLEALEISVLNWAEEFPDGSLHLKQAWNQWRAQQQNDMLQQEIGVVESAPRKHKLL